MDLQWTLNEWVRSWYLQLSVGDDNKTVRLVKIVEYLNDAADVSYKLQ